MKKLLVSLLIIIVVGTACQSSSTTVRPTPEATATLGPITETPTPTQTASSPTRTSIPDTPTSIPPTPSPTHTSIPATETTHPSIDVQVLAIQSFLEEQESAGEFSGSVLIAQQGIPVLQVAHGLADRSLEISNQIDTKFNLGSMDKMFTAIAIMQLVEQGELSLYEKIGKYLPDYPTPEITDKITIHELLIHTSGLGSYFDSPVYLDMHDQIRSIDDYLSLFADEPLQFQSGSQFAYSNSGYIVLGLIIEAVSRQSYYEYVQEHIFVPSDMYDTACYELDAGTPNLAIGYTTLDWNQNDTGQINDNASMLPMRGGSAGGCYSTAPDLLSFRNALLNNQLLNPESTALVMKGKIQIGDNVQYAYGFFNRIVQGYLKVGHGGGFPGVCSILSMYPELEFTIVILSNSDDDCLRVDEFITETLLK
jgi:D-alanyl-D-alanine carboxypeptidase